MNLDASVHLPDVLKRSTINVRVTGRREFKIRLAIGCWLLKVACAVIGAGTVAIDVECSS